MITELQKQVDNYCYNNRVSYLEKAILNEVYYSYYYSLEDGEKETLTLNDLLKITDDVINDNELYFTLRNITEKHLNKYTEIDG